MRARDGELKLGWNKLEGCIGWAWGGAGAYKADGNMLYTHLKMDGPDGKSLFEELEQRGYDLTTLKISIQKKPVFKEDKA